MPELPEVETVVRGIAPHLIARRIEEVRVLRAGVVYGHRAALADTLTGRRIRDVTRLGKQISILLETGDTLAVHLGMTGRLFMTRRDTPLEKHTHLCLRLKGIRGELRFCDPRRFGGIWLICKQPRPKVRWVGRRLPPAGIDALTVSGPDFARLLDRDRQLKALLLDQRVLAGLGNIYIDETLYRAGLHPLTPARTLDRPTRARLCRTMRRVLREAIAAQGSTIDDYRTAGNEPGSFQDRHRVYQRTGLPCIKCGAPIEKFTAAGRSTFICPQCQRRQCG